MSEIKETSIVPKIINKSFGFINNQFINLYNEDNPILNNGDSCYFMFYHETTYHRTIIARGTIVNQLINDSFNIVYFVRLEELLEDKEVLESFVYGKKFSMFKINESSGILTSKLLYLTDKTTFQLLKNNLFKTEGFFVRKTLKAINELQMDYSKVIREDLQKQLDDINQILIKY